MTYLDMMSKLTSTHVYMAVYYTHRVPPTCCGYSKYIVNTGWYLCIQSVYAAPETSAHPYSNGELVHT